MEVVILYNSWNYTRNGLWIKQDKEEEKEEENEIEDFLTPTFREGKSMCMIKNVITGLFPLVATFRYFLCTPWAYLTKTVLHIILLE